MALLAFEDDGAVSGTATSISSEAFAGRRRLLAGGCTLTLLLLDTFMELLLMLLLLLGTFILELFTAGLVREAAVFVPPLALRTALR